MTDTTDAPTCERIVREHARTFALASRLLPREKRRGAFALYAFCRIADDIVDLADARDPGAGARALVEYAGGLTDALGGRPDAPVFRELAWAVQRFEP